MKPGTLSLRGVLRKACALAAAVLVTGCMYEHPAGKPTGEAVDEHFIGTWVADRPTWDRVMESVGEDAQRDLPEILVSRVSDTVIGIEFSHIVIGTTAVPELAFEAHNIDLGAGGAGGKVFEARLTKGPEWDRPYMVVVAAVQDETLTMRFVGPHPGIAFVTSQGVRGYVQMALQVPPHEDDILVLRRKTEPVTRDAAQGDKPGGADTAAAETAAAAWAERYRNATPISVAEFLERIPAVNVRVRADAAVTQHLPMDRILELVKERAAAQGMRYDPQAPVTLSVEMRWKTTRKGMGDHREFFHSAALLTGFFVTAPLARDGGFQLAEFAVGHRWSFGADRGPPDPTWMRGFVNELITDAFVGFRKDTDMPSQADWRASLWLADHDAAMYDAYRAALPMNAAAFLPTLAGMSNVQPVSFLFHGDAGRWRTRIDPLKQEWSARLQRLGLHLDPASRYSVRHHLNAVREATNPRAGSLFGHRGSATSHFFALMSLAALAEDNVSFELEGEFVLIRRAIHSAHANLDVALPDNVDIAELGRATKNALVMEKLEEMVAGSRSPR